MQDTVQNKPEFDTEMHTDLIIQDECEDIKTGNLKLGMYRISGSLV